MIDTHAHIDDPAFDEDRDEVLKTCTKEGVTHIIDAGSSPESLDIILNLTREHSFLYAAMGIHPEYAGFKSMAREGSSNANARLSEYVSSLVSDPAPNKKTVAIGEIGLDYHYDDMAPKDVQEELFRMQIEIAKKNALPIEVHSRDACEDTLRVLRDTDAGAIGCDMHCYGYSKESARDFLNLGCYLGIGGVSTFKNGRKLKEVISYAPLDRLLLETDCPYLTPVPHRGERNAPFYLKYVVSAIAEIKNITEEKVIEETTLNAMRLFPKLAQGAE